MVGYHWLFVNEILCLIDMRFIVIDYVLKLF